MREKISFALPCCERRKNVFNHALSRDENVKQKSFQSLIVALRIARGVELKTSLLFRMFLALIFIPEKLV
jgi:hypothetical protein